MKCIKRLPDFLILLAFAAGNSKQTCQTNKQTNRQTNKQINKQTCQTYKQTDKQTNLQTEIQAKKTCSTQISIFFWWHQMAFIFHSKLYSPYYICTVDAWGPNKRTQFAAHRQAKFYLPLQAPAACWGRRGAGVDKNLEKVLIYPGAMSTPAMCSEQLHSLCE